MTSQQIQSQKNISLQICPWLRAGTGDSPRILSGAVMGGSSCAWEHRESQEAPQGSGQSLVARACPIQEKGS